MELIISNGWCLTANTSESHNSAEQSTRRSLVYYPAHQKENFFTMYPILKTHGCIGCDELWKCDKARQLIEDRLECTDKEAESVISQMIPDVRIEELMNLYSDEYREAENADTTIGSLLGNIAPETIASDEEALQAVRDQMLSGVITDVLSTLTPREEAILKKRYGFNGPEQTLEQVGNDFGITRERVRQIEVKALRKLRHPSRSKKLKDYWL